MTKPYRVLIVEDDADLRKIFQIWLDRNGFCILEASDVPTAVSVLRQDPIPDAIVLDIGLPGRDGYALFDELKDDPRTVGIPVIVVTGYPPVRDQARCMDAGASDFLQKPVDPGVLRAAVDRTLQVP